MFFSATVGRGREGGVNDSHRDSVVALKVAQSTQTQTNSIHDDDTLLSLCIRIRAIWEQYWAHRHAEAELEPQSSIFPNMQRPFKAFWV